VKGRITKTIAHQAETLTGGAKRMIERLTGSRRLRAEDRAGQAKGNIEHAGSKIEDAAEH
jgi:uncharacterized protein YjbJ (UPF0337 family)